MNDLFNLNEPKILSAIWADTRSSGFTLASEPLTCSLLRTLAASKPAARFLELGSGTGLSTAWLLDGMDSESHLTTVDNDEALLFILKRHLGADPRLSLVCADGDEFLQYLHGQHFDFHFCPERAKRRRVESKELATYSTTVGREANKTQVLLRFARYYWWNTSHSSFDSTLRRTPFWEGNERCV